MGHGIEQIFVVSVEVVVIHNGNNLHHIERNLFMDIKEPLKLFREIKFWREHDNYFLPFQIGFIFKNFDKIIPIEGFNRQIFDRIGGFPKLIASLWDVNFIAQLEKIANGMDNLEGAF
jgi:hypothetical protein